LGDSIMQGSSDAAANIQGPAWFNFLTVLSRQQVAFCRNAGIGGNTTAQMLARLDVDVLAYKPRCVVLMGGTNDLPGDGDAAQANIAAIVQRLTDAGIGVALCTIPPRNGDLERRRQIEGYNDGLRRFAAARQLTLIDVFPQLADPTTGTWKPGLSGDGTHPNSRGARVMAAFAGTVLEPLFPHEAPYLTTAASDTANLVHNGLMDQADARGVPADWEASGAADARLATLHAGNGTAGSMLQIVRRAGGSHTVRQSIGEGILPGDRLAISGLIQAGGHGGAAAYGVSVQFYRAAQLVGQITPIADWAIELPQGMFYDEGTVPEGAEWAVVQITTTAPGTVSVGQVAVARLAPGC
jgi:lysophospholipase L1-like esterase